MKPVQYEDYRIKGYAKEKVYDTKGDLVEVNFYEEYDVPTKTYSRLAVKETRTVTRDVTLGIPELITVDIQFFKGDGTTVIATKQLVKPINSHDGMSVNEEARTRLVEKAQGYLLQEIGLANTQEFGADVTTERAAYISGTRQPIIDAINNSARAYLTPTIKATLVAILDVDY